MCGEERPKLRMYWTVPMPSTTTCNSVPLLVVTSSQLLILLHSAISPVCSYTFYISNTRINKFIAAPKWSEVASGKSTPHLLRWVSHLTSLPQLNFGAQVKKQGKSKEEPTKGIAGWHGSYDILILLSLEIVP